MVFSSEEKLDATAGERDFELPSGLSAIFAASSDFVDSINTPGLASVGEKRGQRSHPEQGEGACVRVEMRLWEVPMEEEEEEEEFT